MENSFQPAIYYRSPHAIIQDTNLTYYNCPHVLECISPDRSFDDVLVMDEEFNMFFSSIFHFVVDRKLKEIDFHFEFVWNRKSRDKFTFRLLIGFRSASLYCSIKPAEGRECPLDQFFLESPNSKSPPSISDDYSVEDFLGDDELLLKGSNWLMTTKNGQSFHCLFPMFPLEHLVDYPLSTLKELLLNGAVAYAKGNNRDYISVVYSDVDIPCFLRVYLPSELPSWSTLSSQTAETFASKKSEEDASPSFSRPVRFSRLRYWMDERLKELFSEKSEEFGLPEGDLFLDFVIDMVRRKDATHIKKTLAVILGNNADAFVEWLYSQPELTDI